MSLFTGLFLYVSISFDTLQIGCNNGIGGFHKNFVTFRDSKLPDFLLA